MLSVSGLNTYYGESHVIRDVSFEVGDGESVAIMGRNGMGKSTLLKSLIGVLAPRSGAVRLNGKDLSRLESFGRVAAGMGYVPQGRMIFPYLTVEENILAGMETAVDRAVPDYIYEVFPVLKEMKGRKGGNLSGGQQQQLAIARALVSKPRLLILDEPTEGIQPSIIKDIAKALNQLRADHRFSLLVSEQVLSFTMDIADRFLIIEKGAFVYEAPRDQVDTDRLHGYLTI